MQPAMPCVHQQSSQFYLMVNCVRTVSQNTFMLELMSCRQFNYMICRLSCKCRPCNRPAGPLSKLASPQWVPISPTDSYGYILSVFHGLLCMKFTWMLPTDWVGIFTLSMQQKAPRLEIEIHYIHFLPARRAFVQIQA